jgi:hypothetical protein
MWATQKFLPYMEFAHFTIKTDHNALQSILDLKEPCGRVKRWAMRLASMNCTITYRRGKQNLVAEALRRATIELLTSPRETIVDRILPAHDEESQVIMFEIPTEETKTSPEHQCNRCSEQVRLREKAVQENLKSQGEKYRVLQQRCENLGSSKANTANWGQ